MALIVSGVVVLAATIFVFIFMMPRGGKVHRLVGTEWEPYVAVAFTAAVALGFTLTLSGVLKLIS